MADTPILIDSFTDDDDVLLADHVADTAQAWTKVGTRNALIESNGLYVADYFVGDYATNYVRYSAPVAFITTAQYYSLAIYAWALSANAQNNFSLFLRNDGGSFLKCEFYYDGEHRRVRFIDETGTFGDASISNSLLVLGWNTIYCTVGSDNVVQVLINENLILTGSRETTATAMGASIIFEAGRTRMSGDMVFDDLSAGNFTAALPADPTLLTSTCISGISESMLPDAPVASFTADAYSGMAPLTVNFTDHSTNTPTSWLWEFGDGDSSTDQNPTNIFSVGTYTVRLTATNAYGSSSYQRTIISTAIPVVAPPIGGIVIAAGLSTIGYYAVDTPNNNVLIYDVEGNLLITFGGIGTEAGEFWMPTTCSVVNGTQLIDRIIIINNEEGCG